MIRVNRDLIIALKEERRAKLPIQSHVNGDCIHSGKISYGCKSCFKRTNNSMHAVYCGVECNLNCPVCYHDQNRKDNMDVQMMVAANLAGLYQNLFNPDFNPEIISYNSNGEPLKYPQVILEASKMLKQFRPNLNYYSFIYTNGTLMDKDMLEFLKSCNIKELRVHISASNFSDIVLSNMELASNMGFIVSVEEPGLPENLNKIKSLYPFFNDIKLKHLNIIECRVTKFNIEYLNKKYPEGRYYRDTVWAMYDEGMVYDLMEEKLLKNMNFSIMDCSANTEYNRSNFAYSLTDIYNLSELDDKNSIEEAVNKDW